MRTYYEVLGLPEALLKGCSNLSAQTVRGAYRRALLQNHPDKSANPALSSSAVVYSIDQISEAFSVLSNTEARAKYDQELKLQNTTPNGAGVDNKHTFRTGVESVDLDDLTFDVVQRIWYRGCRCGEEKGFLMKEEDLEEAAEDGEISVGCRGCSLWLKVLFGVVEEKVEIQDQTLADARDHKG